MYKVSFDKKTIQEVPKEIPLYQYLREKLNAKQVIEDSFTRMDLAQGETKELIVQLNRRRYTSVKILAGKNLCEADLTAKYNNFGNRI